MSTTTTIISELERLANAMAADSEESAEITLPSVAARIAKSVGVRADEVAILAVSNKFRRLNFLAPEALIKVGNIPLTSTSALAARTVREKRAEIDNQFAEARHARVFEGVKIGGESAEAIQKIISVPIQADGEVLGVIQISRKGPSVGMSGPDFTSEDIVNVQALCVPLAHILQLALQE